ncbi:MAG: cyanophycinase [Peptococcaceae bacterium]|nr:cyanophycinase [Peptococcaceae bacterium]
MEVKGRLLVIGGAEDKNGECQILQRFVELAGGSKGVIAVITAAAEAQNAVGDEYRELFVCLGAGTVQVLHVANRQQANDPEMLAKVEGASGVYFTGGDQLRITSLVGGTALDALLKELFRQGAVIAGTSAGASAMSDNMIVAGDGEEEPRREAIRMAPGLGLVRHAVVDQHFAQRGRIGRLLGALAQNPAILGIGIDEDTAIEVEMSGTFSVVGNGCVTVLDGRGITISDISDITSEQPLALCDVLLHCLPTGYSFDLKTRRPSPIRGAR